MASPGWFERASHWASCVQSAAVFGSLSMAPRSSLMASGIRPARACIWATAKR
jgi:hypothetical protein